MYHLHVRWMRIGRVGGATRRLEYISRTGRYRNRPDRVRVLASKFMPNWVIGDDSANYWRAADGPTNRINARVLYTIEFALPLQLSTPDQNDLTLQFVSDVAQFSWRTSSLNGGGRVAALPVTVAIHEGFGRNPHAHVQLSTSIFDGYSRSEKQWFRRASSVDPQVGARRARKLGSLEWLLYVRRTWARMANAALKVAGFAPDFDHRSYKVRGVDKRPDVHRGPVHAATPTIGGRSWSAFQNKIRQQLNALAPSLRRRAKVAEDDSALAEQSAMERRNAIRRASEARLLEDLAAHAFADENCQMNEHATVVVVADSSEPSALQLRIATPEFEKKVVERLGTGWICRCVGDRVFIVRPPRDDVIVAGPGVLATDSSDPELLHGFGKVASLLALRRPTIWAKAGLRDAMHKRLALESLEMDWEADEVGPKSQKRRIA